MSNNMNRYFSLGFYPTPLEKLVNLSRVFTNTYTIYIKRDDQTGLATGGNKTRKLEYLIQDALDQGCDSIITSGASQSNHCRQAAAAVNKAGLECHLILKGDEPSDINGNLLLDRILGATIHWSGEEPLDKMGLNIAGYLRENGYNPYIIPIGGSNEVGAMGYIKAVGELKEQLLEQGIAIDYVFFPSCSGGTHAGLVLGKYIHNLEFKLLGVSVAKDPGPDHRLIDYIREIVENGFIKLNLAGAVPVNDVELVDGYNEAGYGVITSNETKTIKFLAQTEGILLDPVYTARAFYGMIDILEKRKIAPGSKILFWHTGGVAANFGYADQLIK